jgi:uncharacterized protein (TIGR02594 family)
MATPIPPWLATMRQITGTRALHDNPVILGWAKKIGELFPDTAAYCGEYKHDTIAWCGLTVGYCMATSGIKPVFGTDAEHRFFWALAWRDFGTDGKADGPQPGDVLVFDFGSGHHVTLYERTEGDTYVCRGGNQSHQVKLSSFARRNCVAIRRPPELSITTPLEPVHSSAQLISGITATVFGGAQEHKISPYDGHLIDDVELGVALPCRVGEPRPNICVWKDGQSVVCKIVGIGPWNIDDPYWLSGARPKAESDASTNGAGIDLTPAAAHVIGLKDKGVVDWEFVETPLIRPLLLPGLVPSSPDLLQQLAALLEGKMPATAPSPPPSGQPDLGALIEKVLGIMQALPQGTQPPQTSTQQGPPVDQVQQFIKLLSSLVGGAAAAGGPSPLGPVNGALGDTIGNLLNGKKSALGILGAMVTAVLQAVGPSLATQLPVVGSFAGLGGAALPIFLALAAWGVLGKMEKAQTAKT